ncbi:MAG: hypothetical protein WD850_02125 [Candidatus Spechtbacterales bacterium]
MANPTAPHLYSFIQQHHTILCVAAGRNGFDTLPAARALVHIAEQVGNTARIATKGPVPPVLAFLDMSAVIAFEPSSQDAPSLRIAADASTIGRVSYRRHANHVDIYLSAPDGERLEAHALPSAQTDLSWDGVVFVGDVAEEEVPASLREDVREGRIAALAICVKPPTVPLAPVSLIDEGARSVAEAITRILKKEREEAITNTVATALLTGLIAATQNFQHPATRPQALFAAAYLIGKHADKTTIVRHLYKTKPITLIKLWGYVLAKFSYDPATSIGHSTITNDDFARSGAPRAHAAQVLLELKNNFAQARVLVLAVERGAKAAVALVYTADASATRALGRLPRTRRRGLFFLVSLPHDPSLKNALRRLLALLR